MDKNMIKPEKRGWVYKFKLTKRATRLLFGVSVFERMTQGDPSTLTDPFRMYAVRPSAMWSNYSLKLSVKFVVGKEHI